MAFGVAICVASLAPSLGLFIALLAGRRGGADLLPRHVQLARCSSAPIPPMRGRVMAVYTITLLGSTPIGGPLIGWISEQFGPRWGFALGGIATIVGVLAFGTAFVRARRRDERGRGDRGAPTSSCCGIDGESIPASIR